MTPDPNKDAPRAAVIHAIDLAADQTPVAGDRIIDTDAFFETLDNAGFVVTAILSKLKQARGDQG